MGPQNLKFEHKKIPRSNVARLRKLSKKARKAQEASIRELVADTQNIAKKMSKKLHEHQEIENVREKER